jgi:type II secretory pathway pseudopilin PulG
MTRSRPAFSALSLLVVLALLLLGLALLLPAVQRVRGAAGQAQSMNNLKQLALAAHNYHDTYRSFPPGVGQMQQATGSLHFHLLPFIEQTPLFQNANGKVWENGTYGKPLAVFVDPRDAGAPPGNVYQNWLATTNYAGNWLVFKDGKQRITGITDGTSNTLMFAQRYQLCNGQPTAWGYPSLYYWAPLFAHYSTARFQVAPTQEACDPALAQAIGPVILVGLCDGTVRALDGHVDANIWHFLCDPRDNHVVQLD